MKVLSSPAAFLEGRAALKGSVGFVPTMGALHAGHAALLARSRKENQHSVLSLFVNPTQFDRAEDLRTYPRTFEADLALAEEQGVDLVFAPEDPKLLYPDNYRTRVTESELSQVLCGKSRPGHFDGVLTVVLKLLQITQAHRAYFGEKDFQQLELVRQMADAFFLSTTIVPCPIVRDVDGLALSSRNVRLTPRGRNLAGQFAKILADSTTPLEHVRQRLLNLGVEIDYLEDRTISSRARRFAAVHVDGVRLIDNVPLPGGGSAHV